MHNCFVRRGGGSIVRMLRSYYLQVELDCMVGMMLLRARFVTVMLLDVTARVRDICR